MMMTTLAYIVVGFGILRLVIATLNLLLQERLPQPRGRESLPSLSVLIPARNEANNIEALLSDLTHVKSGCLIEIIVCDDASEDSTAELVETWMQRDSRIRLIYSSGPPSGWLGKNHACHLLSREARGEYLLFLDADVRLNPAFIERALSYATTHRLGLLSLFPRQRMQTWAERVSVPNMHLILLSLLLLPSVRRVGFSSLSAANGQCMLFNGAVYRVLQPHDRFRHSRAEDIAIAREFKRKGYRISCMSSTKLIECRMYDSLSAAIEGFAKNITLMLGGSYILALLYWSLTSMGWLAVWLGRAELLLPYLLTELAIRVFVSICSNQSIVYNIILAPAQQLLLGLFIIKSWVNSRRKLGFTWKGRSI